MKILLSILTIAICQWSAFGIPYVINNAVAGSTNAWQVAAGGNLLVGQNPDGSLFISTNFTFDANGNFSQRGQPVANLIAAQAGANAYSTDVLTPAGSGSDIWYDGTSWRLVGYNIKATIDPVQFVLNSWEAAYPYQSRVTDFRIDTEEYSPININFPRVQALTGTGAGASHYNAYAQYGDYGALTSGTASPGWNHAYSTYVTAMGAGLWYACGGAYAVFALSTGAQPYWCVMGLTSVAGPSTPVEGAYFLYDCQTNTGPSIITYVNGLAGAQKVVTNNWICVTAHASAFTYQDSGLPVTTSGAIPNRLGIIYTNGAALFYTNGSLSAALVANLPTTTLYLNRLQISNVLANASSPSIIENSPWRYIRHPSRTYP
jgi:hypothetical protein